MDILESLKSVVSNAAPLLASAIGAANPLAGMAVSLVAKEFGASSDPADILDKIQHDPEAAIKLKKIQLEHELSLKRIAAENFKTATEDKKSARNTAVQGGESYRKFLRWFAILITIGFFVTLATLFIPETNINSAEKDMVMMLVGVLVSKFSTIVDFFYGSSNPNEE